MIMIKKQILFLSMIIFLSSFVYGALSDSLVAWYSFDSPTPRQNNTMNTSFNWNNNGVNWTTNSTPACIDGGCVWGEGTNNDRLEGAGIPTFSVGFTIAYWIYFNRTAGVQDEVPFTFQDNNWLFQYRDTNGTSRFLLYNAAGSSCSQLAFTPTVNKWYQVIWWGNSTHYRIYLNGTKLTLAGVSNIACAGYYNKGRVDVLFNEDNVGGYRYDFEGMFDDFTIWNRGLSDSELEEMNITTYADALVPTPDTTPPNISMIYPLNTTLYDNYNGTFLINATDDTSVDDCNINDTNWDKQGIAGNTWLWNWTTVIDGNYSIFVNCTDPSNNENNITVWFYYDGTIPVIDFNTTGSTNTTINLSLNISENVTLYWVFGLNCTHNLNSGTETLNDTFFLNQSGLINNTQYAYNITINDTINNSNNYCILISTSVNPSTTITTMTELTNTEKAYYLFASSFLFLVILSIGLYIQNYYILFFGGLYGLMLGLWIYQNLPIFPELLGLSVMIFSVYVGLVSLFSKKVTI